MKNNHFLAYDSLYNVAIQWVKCSSLEKYFFNEKDKRSFLIENDLRIKTETTSLGCLRFRMGEGHF